MTANDFKQKKRGKNCIIDTVYSRKPFAREKQFHAQVTHKKQVSLPAGEFLYRRMVSEARGDLFVKATCLENSDQSLTLFLPE